MAHQDDDNSNKEQSYLESEGNGGVVAETQDANQIQGTEARVSLQYQKKIKPAM